MTLHGRRFFRRDAALAKRFLAPVWKKAPFVLVRYPAIFVAVAGAAVVIAATSAGGPLFLSSAENAALNRELESSSPELAGLTIAAFVDADREGYQSADAAIRQQASQVSELGEPTASILTTGISISRPDPSEETSVRLLFRTHALTHITRLDQAKGRGVWIAESTAKQLSVRAGDRIVLRGESFKAEVLVAGVYKDLASSSLSDYWKPMSFQIFSPIPNQPPANPFVISERNLLLRILDRVPRELRGIGAADERATFRWQFPLRTQGMTLPEANSVASQFIGIRNEVNNPASNIGLTMALLDPSGGAEVSTKLPDIIEISENTVTALEGFVRLVSLAASIGALVLIAAAGMFAFQRRREEARFLSAQGVHPVSLGVKAALEVVSPAIMGGITGWAATIWLVKRLGPTDLLSAGVPVAALEQVAWGLLLGIVLLGFVFGVSCYREANLGSARLRGILVKIPWEPAILALAAASFYELTTRRPPTAGLSDPVEVDLLLLSFPLLLVIGGVGIVVRILKRWLPKLRHKVEGSRAVFFLAANRLASSSGMAQVVVTICAIALGILVYSSSVVSITGASADDKTRVRAGSEVVVKLAGLDELPSDLALPGTAVARAGARLFPGDVAVDVLAIDPSDFALVAFWKSSFANRSLARILGDMSVEEDRRIPVAVAGIRPRGRATLELAEEQLPIRIVEVVRAWPGMSASTPLLIADRVALEKATTARQSWQTSPFPTQAFEPPQPFSTFELWARGDPDSIVEGLDNAGVIVYDVQTTDEVRALPPLSSSTWPFGFMRALGIMSGAIGALVTLLYLQARQRSRQVAYALTRRMGLSRIAHMGAVALELASMLLVSYALGGGVALIASRVVLPHLDPAPALPPAPVFLAPRVALWAIVGALVIATVLGAWRVQRSADRTNVAEAIRLAN